MLFSAKFTRKPITSERAAWLMPLPLFISPDFAGFELPKESFRIDMSC